MRQLVLSNSVRFGLRGRSLFTFFQGEAIEVSARARDRLRSRHGLPRFQLQRNGAFAIPTDPLPVDTGR